MIKVINGQLTIVESGFMFDSGKPENESVIDFAVGCHKSKVEIEKNGCIVVEFYPRGVVVPPVMDNVLKENNLCVKRTSRNFIVTMKFPIIESKETTVESHKEMWKKATKAIVETREQIKNEF